MSPLKALILQVENDADDIFLTQRAFKRAGHMNPIVAVENGEQGRAYLLGEGRFASRADYPLPAVILLDWNMPLMSGAAFLEWLRAHATLKRLLVVVFTSSDNQGDMRQAYDLGANGYIVKPRSLETSDAMARAFVAYWLQWNRSEAVGPTPSL